MITKVSELLEEFIAVESAVLSEQGIVHAPTIGEMYEGLSAEILELALPLENSDLRIVRGFIRPKQEGPLSSEIDCMIVIGEGEVVPRTQKFIYPIERVLVTFEIKKTLTRPELSKTLLKLNDFKRLCEPMFHNGFSDEAFARTLGKRPLVAGNPEIIGEENELLVDVIIADANQPLRVILDYSGYKTSKGFLHAFRDVIVELSEADETGTVAHPGYWPDLIVGPNFEVVKLFGNPYSVKQGPNGDVDIMAISNGPHRLLLLEMILWRISAFINRFIPIYSDFVPPELATVLTLNLSEEGYLKAIDPEAAVLSDLQINHDETPKQLSFLEAKVAHMFLGLSHFSLADEEVWVGLEITEDELRNAISRLESLGVCFVHDDVAFGTYKTLGIGASQSEFICAENCRGVLGRLLMRQGAQAAKDNGQDTFPIFHISTREPLDFTNAVLTQSTISAEELVENPGHLDLIRFRSTEIARNLLERNGESQ